jgi:XTP/dITP diphosphohydrolase
MRLLVATGNEGKVREIRRELERAELTGVAMILPGQIGGGPSVNEDQPDFVGNAVKKARAFALDTGLLTLAEDSGLCVDALGGAPGVFSARYAGEPCDDLANNRKLLAALRDVPPARRTARFVCAAALAHPRATLVTMSDQLEGMIALAPRGTGGFGYDPLFFIPEIGRTTAELSPEEKARISHRGKTLRRLLQWLKERQSQFEWS